MLLAGHQGKGQQGREEICSPLEVTEPQTPDHLSPQGLSPFPCLPTPPRPNWLTDFSSFILSLFQPPKSSYLSHAYEINEHGSTGLVMRVGLTVSDTKAEL